MKRKLITQLFNEWQSNIWLIVELIIVGTALWFVSTILFYVFEIKNEPNGYNVDDVYVVNLLSISPDSPDYVDTDNENQKVDEINSIIDRIRMNPEVLSVGTGVNLIYNFNYFGNNISVADEGEPIETSSMGPNVRYFTPELAELLSIEGANESPKKIREILEKGEILLTSNVLDENENTLENHIKLIGRHIYLGRDTTVSRRIGGIIKPIKRYDFEPPMSSIIIPINIIDARLADKLDQIIVKVKPGTGDRFKKNIEQNIARQYAIGNTYAISVESYNDISSEIHRNDYHRIYSLIICMIFLMTSIFLGLLGTFWFRTGERVSEIAIRKVNGATSADIFRRLISEGLLLLLASVPFALILDILIVKLEFVIDIYVPYNMERVATTFIIVNLMLAAMIILGIFFPAKKAMGINPAEALKDE